MSIADVLAGDDAPQLAERLVGLLALGAGRNEIRIRRKDGSVRHCLVHASTIGADRLLGLLLDITDRKEAEEKLRESEERFRSLSEAAFEAILVHDGGRIVDVNHALCELGGYSWHELVGRDGFELIAPEYRELVYRNLLAEYTGALRDRGACGATARGSRSRCRRARSPTGARSTGWSRSGTSRSARRPSGCASRSSASSRPRTPSSSASATP